MILLYAWSSDNILHYRVCPHIPGREIYRMQEKMEAKRRKGSLLEGHWD